MGLLWADGEEMVACPHMHARNRAVDARYSHKRPQPPPAEKQATNHAKLDCRCCRDRTRTIYARTHTANATVHTIDGTAICTVPNSTHTLTRRRLRDTQAWSARCPSKLRMRAPRRSEYGARAEHNRPKSGSRTTQTLGQAQATRLSKPGTMSWTAPLRSEPTKGLLDRCSRLHRRASTKRNRVPLCGCEYSEPAMSEQVSNCRGAQQRVHPTSRHERRQPPHNRLLPDNLDDPATSDSLSNRATSARRGF